MVVHINYWGVLLAGISSMIIGSIYYADYLFGKDWRKLANIDAKRFEVEMPKVMPIIFLGALIISYVTAFFTYIYHSFFNHSWFLAGVETSIILWFGISLTTLVVHGLLEQKPYKLLLISVGNRLLSLLAIGAIVGWLHP